MRASSILFFMSQQQINKEQTHTILLLGSTEQYIRTHQQDGWLCVCVCGEIISTHCGDRCNEQRGALRTSIDSSEHFSTKRFLPNFTGHSLTHSLTALSPSAVVNRRTKIASSCYALFATQPRDALTHIMANV